MHAECHFTLGWILAHAAHTDRRLRNWCVAGAVLPDIDAVSYLFGIDAYAKYHHTLGHNVWLWFFFVSLATWRMRSWRAFLLTFLSFGLHLLTDAWTTRWELYLWWPLSSACYSLPDGIDLASPINTALFYLSFFLLLVMAFIYRRTPLDIFSPALDAALLSPLRHKNDHCHLCGRPCAQKCIRCGKGICFRHSHLGKKFCLVCPQCAKT
jgi:hypothetical protein